MEKNPRRERQQQKLTMISRKKMKSSKESKEALKEWRNGNPDIAD
jgi:hypothetical protein